MEGKSARPVSVQRGKSNNALAGKSNPLTKQRNGVPVPTTKMNEMELNNRNLSPNNRHALPKKPAKSPKDIPLSSNISSPKGISKVSETIAVEKSINTNPNEKQNEKENKSTVVADRSVFIGKNSLQYALFGHYLAYYAALLAVLLGIFEIAYKQPAIYKCEINGELIDSSYIMDGAGTCPTIYYEPDGGTSQICCNSNNEGAVISGSYGIGLVTLFWGIITVVINDENFGTSLWFPNDTWFYSSRVSGLAILYFIFGLIMCTSYLCCLAGVVYLTSAAVYAYAAYRQECGDGGYFQNKDAAEKKRKAAEAAAEKAAAEKEANADIVTNGTGTFKYEYDLLDYYDLVTTMTCSNAFHNIYEILYKAYNEDKISTYIWLFVYVVGNIYYFFETVDIYYRAIDATEKGLLDGTLEIQCQDDYCFNNRSAIMYGPISTAIPWAKGGGKCLNMNCAFVLLPVTKLLINKLVHAGKSFSRKVQTNSIFAKFFAHPISRYIPLQKNIEFHIFLGGLIMFYTIIHVLFHLINLYYASSGTLQRFGLWGWNGTYIFTGAVITVVMFIMYGGVPERVRRSKFEVFFYSHHLYIIFIGMLFLHGHTFYKWAIVPCLLFVIEKYLDYNKAKVDLLVTKVEWIPPVMALYFRPKNKEDFKFKEGQYLMLKCPHISDKEWHPFTISSAHDDLQNGPRINLETGEEVIAVPRPAGLKSTARWNKYCDVSKDWRNIPPDELLDKSDTGYNDFISLHIKVFGLDQPVAKSWTRKLKEYFELMSPGKSFPYYFTRRDHRGDLQLGRSKGPDELPIIAIEGPFSAPAQHFSSYNTVMLVGAGIGLTPCASILTALTKYRWKKNFPPEIVHFYWVVRHNEVESFQWLVHLLTELSYDLKRARESKQIDSSYYCEINIYVTAAPKNMNPLEKGGVNGIKLKRAAKTYSEAFSKPFFSAEQLYHNMLYPTVDSKNQSTKMRSGNGKAPNRLQDIWVWSGRPMWDDIFETMKTNRQHSDIGVCFCGAPAIGSDLQHMCEKYSDAADECLFTLHKENF